MRKAVVILIIFLLGAGLTQPTGLLKPFNLHEKYAQCSKEDHDITSLDFVFEHLLNLEAIVNIIEGENEYHSGDCPHEPFQLVNTALEIAATIPNYISFEAANPYPTDGFLKHISLAGDFYLSHFLSELLRPPIQH